MSARKIADRLLKGKDKGEVLSPEVEVLARALKDLEQSMKQAAFFLKILVKEETSKYVVNIDSWVERNKEYL
jgi:hypothetical protein